MIGVLEKLRSQANFGNVGALETLIRNALSKAASRPTSLNGRVQLLPEDFDDGTDAANQDPLAPLDGLYRVDHIRQQLIELRNAFQVKVYSIQLDCFYEV